MATVFSLLCQVCGLSQSEAARLLDARLDTIKSWSSGRRHAPGDAIEQLAELAAAIDAAADEAVDHIVAQADAMGSNPEAIELGLAADDHEARGLGWPCVGAHRAVLALTVARGMAEGFNFNIVPRGSTVATAASADVHDRHKK